MRTAEGKVVRFTSYPMPRFVRRLSEQPYRPSNEPQTVVVAYHGKRVAIVLRSWEVCEGVEPVLNPDEFKFEVWDTARRFVEQTHSDLEMVERVDADPVRIMATWV